MDIVVMSHLRWDFVYQRPQHLMSRAARSHRVLFVEESVEGEAYEVRARQAMQNVDIMVPVVPHGTPEAEAEAWLSGALRDHVAGWAESTPLLWHYAAMAEPLTRGLQASLIVYDCMDELSAFLGAPPQLVERERALLERADLVFTGGYSLYEAKRDRHARVHPFPSSVDVAHFRDARRAQAEPQGLAGIGRPRLMYAGVIDERLDLDLVRHLAAADVGEVVLVGPVAKIDEGLIPTAANVHRLGMQRYDDLPAFFAHADVGLMPFALNEATRYISPTKTPEYLAAGLPVVSTRITDVIRGYGDLDTVHIAADADEFVEASRRALDDPQQSPAVEERLAGMSWDATWSAMEALIDEAISERALKREPEGVPV